MENVERIQARLDNIRSVQPILEALRTISLGSWQAVQKQRVPAQQYEDQLLAIAAQLQPYLGHFRLTGEITGKKPSQRIATLVIGSERGLCGRFNRTIAEKTNQYIMEQTKAGQQIELLAVGRRLGRYLQRQQHPLTRTSPLPKSAAALAKLALELSQGWLADYEAHHLDAVDLIFNTYQGVGRYRPAILRLIPPALLAPAGQLSNRPDPGLIIETDPLNLFIQLAIRWITLALYTRLLASAAAEHSARYQLMEAASQNAKRLIDELTLSVQTARRQAITEEMQTLVAGAGLVGRPDDFSG